MIDEHSRALYDTCSSDLALSMLRLEQLIESLPNMRDPDEHTSITLSLTFGRLDPMFRELTNMQAMMSVMLMMIARSGGKLGRPAKKHKAKPDNT